MTCEPRIPAPVRSRYLEWRASRISDPVSRLRYLRESSGAVTPWNIQDGCGFRVRSWKAIAPIAILLLIFVPGPVPSNTRTIADWERSILLPPAGAFDTASRDVVPKVWLVEQSADSDLYSNGLRVENRFAVPNKPRGEYLIWNVALAGEPEHRTGTEPAGIVYHTTESHLVAFEEQQTRRLRRIGRGLLDYVREKRAYHFLIDRFGQVFRVVEESDVANHAGFSVWADERGVYVNLNDSFLGVSFEGQTLVAAEAEQRDRTLRPGTHSINTAQVTAARQLTEMLRSKYRIAPRNCITHAQVSVNPHTMQIGWHTDGSQNFPFAALGLPDNYRIPMPSLYRFGFEYGRVFLKAIGGTPWSGVLAGEEQFHRQASAHGMPVSRYKAMLQERYRQILNRVKAHSAGEENP